MNSRLSYAKGEETTPLTQQSIGQFFRDLVLLHGSRQALVSQGQGQRLSYAELSSLVEQSAQSLITLGVTQGDRVALWSSNRIEWIVLQFAVVSIGAILVHINPALKAHEVEFNLLHSSSKLLFLTPRYRQTHCLGIGMELKNSCPQLERVISLDDENADLNWPAFLSLALEFTPTEIKQIFPPNVNCHQAASIQYTSGTTGQPKGATLSHFNMLNNAIQVGSRLGLTPSDVVCLPVPLFHCAGCVVGVLAAFTKGASIVLTGESFDVVECLNAIEREHCTSIVGVPMMYISILHHPAFDTKRCISLKKGIVGASPCPTEVFKSIMEQMHLKGLSNSYGMTESSPMSAQNNPNDSIELRSQTVGYIHAHIELKVIDPRTKEVLPKGQTGELCVKGYSVMLGYWNNPKATQEAIDSQGWLHTGDLAIMTENDYISIVGRIKDMVIRSGENIYPKEIEEFLHELPQIAAAQVFGVPDALYGEQLAAWIIFKSGEALSSEQLKVLCREKMAHFKVPHYWKFVDAFPSTTSGKAQKFKMREMMIQEYQLKYE